MLPLARRSRGPVVGVGSQAGQEPCHGHRFTFTQQLVREGSADHWVPLWLEVQPMFFVPLGLPFEAGYRGLQGWCDAALLLLRLRLGIGAHC